MYNNYDTINSFLINNSISNHTYKRWLFFDIHINDKYLTLVSIFYPDMLFKSKDIEIYQESKEQWLRLPLFCEYKRCKYETIRILRYKLIDNNLKNTIKVKYFDQEKTFWLEHDKYTKKHLALATLFLHDSYLIPRWLDYYRKKGVEHFYLFYNGKLDDNLRNNLIQAEDITIGEWDFPYWTEGVILNSDGSPTYSWKIPILKSRYRKFVHHAQLPFMNNILTKYGHRHDWIGFIDLDEMIVYPDNKKFELSRLSFNVAAVVMPSYWAIDIEPESGKVLRNSTHCGKARTKAIVRPNRTTLVRIHKPYRCNGKVIWINKSKYSIYHLINTNNVSRMDLVKDPIIDRLRL